MSDAAVYIHITLFHVTVILHIINAFKWIFGLELPTNKSLQVQCTYNYHLLYETEEEANFM